LPSIEISNRQLVFIYSPFFGLGQQFYPYEGRDAIPQRLAGGFYSGNCCRAGIGTPGL
jgi:hypothetical protein